MFTRLLPSFLYQDKEFDLSSKPPNTFFETHPLTFSAFAMSERGAAHKDNDLPVQDASGCRMGEKYSITAVADGHGGEKYIRSQIGSSLAVQCALNSLEEFIAENGENVLKNASHRDAEKVLKQLEGAVIHQWRDAVELDIQEHPLTEQEVDKLKSLNVIPNPARIYSYYGTTLLYACLLDGYWFISQIGDGQASCVNMDGNTFSPIQEDDRLLCGITTSLCGFEAGNDFRRAFSKNTVRGIVIATDGVVDSYSKETYPVFVRNIVEKFIVQPEAVKEAMRQWLPIISERGSRDDISLGCALLL